MKYIWNFGEHEKVGREPRPVGIGAHLEKNRRTRGLARGNPQQNAQAHQGSGPGRRRGVEVDGHSDLVARRHHLHWRIGIRPVSSTRVSTETTEFGSSETSPIWHRITELYAFGRADVPSEKLVDIFAEIQA